jgi:hypothetical protein
LLLFNYYQLKVIISKIENPCFISPDFNKTKTKNKKKHLNFLFFPSFSSLVFFFSCKLIDIIIMSSSSTIHLRNHNLNEISNAVDAADSSDFHKSTFALKRTKSLGLFDEFLPQKTQEIGNTSADNINTDAGEQNTNNPKSPTISIVSYDSACPKQSPPASPCSFTSQDTLEIPDLLPIHDDSNLQHEPSRHVDYLSYDWKESDISTCWRNIVSHRRDVANSVRLENASWRTWTKAKYNLHTVAPESVNWSKDCDVTWLYGPLYNPPANVYSHEPNLHKSALHENVVSVAAPKKPGFKPILKKQKDKIFSPPVDRAVGAKNNLETTAAQSAHKGKKKEVASEHKYVSTYLRHHNYRHRPHTGQSDENISRQINLQYSRSDLLLRNPTLAPSRLMPNKPTPPQLKERHIHFNDRVEQCIAVDENWSDNDLSMSSDDEDFTHCRHPYKNRFDIHSAKEDESEDDENDSDDDEPGLFLMLRSNSTTSLQGRPGLTKLKSASMSDIPHSIAPLPATTLKCGLDEEEEQNKRRNHALHSMMVHDQRRKHNHYVGYDYNSIYESPSAPTAVNQKDIVQPSSILQDAEESVEMPMHLLGKMNASGDVVLPPVLTVNPAAPVATPEAVEQHNFEMIHSNSTNSSIISEKRDGEDVVMEDSPITRVVRSAKNLVSHGMWAWK